MTLTSADKVWELARHKRQNGNTQEAISLYEKLIAAGADLPAIRNELAELYLECDNLIVSSDSALVHVAGAMGLQVWMATGYSPDWRWLDDREDSPWYPSLRLFRQPSIGDWKTVFEHIAAAIREEKNSPKTGAPESR